MVTEMVSVSDIFWSERSSGSLVAPKTQSTRRTNSGPAQKTRARMFGLLVGKMSGLGWQWNALSWLHSCLHACMWCAEEGCLTLSRCFGSKRPSTGEQTRQFTTNLF